MGEERYREQNVERDVGAGWQGLEDLDWERAIRREQRWTQRRAAKRVNLTAHIEDYLHAYF